MSLKRSAILKAQDIKTVPVPCPEWATDGDDVVLVRGWSGEQRDRFEISLGTPEKRNFENLRAKTVADSCVDDDGNLLFSPEDVEALGKKSAIPLDRLFAVARILNGMSDQDIEELIGNLKPGPKDGTISA